VPPYLSSRLVKRLLALTAVVALASCASLAKAAFQSPVVTVRDVTVRRLGLQGATLDVHLDIRNPNEYRIDAEKVSYTFFVDSTAVVNGELTQRLTLEERGTMPLTVPVSFDYIALQTAMRYYLARGALDYRVEGMFTLVTPVGRLTRPYSGRGRVEGMP
jgi:LEA14-like dessication related protein